MYDQGIPLTAFAVDELDTEYERLVQAGVTFPPHYGRFLRLVPERLIEMTWLTAMGTRGTRPS